MRNAASFVLACVLVAFAPRAAQACGGFFCSQVPVDQSGEQILFSVNGNHVTAHIQISYQGAAKDFAWVVPVTSKPTITLGSRTVFQQLLQQTQPQFQVLWPPGSCGINNRGGAGGLPPPGAAPVPTAGDTGVVVIDQREVGPFETVILEATNSQALVDWLNKNHFDQPPAALPLIDHYVKAGMLFVALRLTKDAMTGEIQPIVFDMDNDAEACVPLILTRIAAVPDMPIYVFLLNKTRAVPRNWFEVEVNPRKIDWFSSGSNYRALATAAIDEAAGHGFITEYAGPSDFMKNTLFQVGRWNLDKLRTITSPGLFVQALLQQGLPRDQTMLALLRKHIPLPQSLADRGVTEQQFYNMLAAQPGSYPGELATLKFDPVAFVADIEERIVKPLRDAQALFDTQPYLTRLFSTVSPSEMTRDPLFHFNPDLKTVSNYHRALATGTCSSDGSYRDLTLIFENAEKMEFPGPVQPFMGRPWAYAADEPAARHISLLGPTGRPTTFYSRAQAKVADGFLDRETAEAVRSRNLADLSDPVMPGPTPTPGPTTKSSNSGCAIGGGPSGAASLLVFLALVGIRRRSRR